MTLTHQTKIAVQVFIDTDSHDITALVMALTVLISLLLKLGHFVNTVGLWVSDFNEAAQFTHTVFTIGFKALAWGFAGVRL